MLAPFADRGYEHDPESWRRWARKYPDVDLYLEARKLAGWLRDPDNRKAQCSDRRIGNWLKRAQADALAAPAPAPRTNGHAGNGVYHQPITQQGRNPGPPDLPLFEGPVQRIDDGEMARFVAARRDTPLAEKLKARHGRHG